MRRISMPEPTAEENAERITTSRRDALGARERYDAALGFFDAMRAGNRGPVSPFWAAVDLGRAGYELSEALDELDVRGDDAGFHAGFESAAALRALVEAAG